MAAALFGCHPSSLVVEDGGGSSGGVAVETSSTSIGATTGTGSDENSTGEPQFEGPGCGEPLACDRGTFVGHVRIESAQDLAAVAGYTEVTGALEIMNSQDLVCLDALACLEVVGRDVRIQDNAALRSTQGLSALREIGEAHGGGGDWSGDIVIAHNAVLERLAGFSVLEVFRPVVIQENPLLRTVSGFSDVRTLLALWITKNPYLESLVGLRGIEDLRGCYISFNESLCSAEVLEVCGGSEMPLWGAAVQNDVACPAVPDGIFTESEDEQRCSYAADSCPLGEKCMPISTDGGTYLDYQSCRPVVLEAGRPGEACSVLAGEGDGLDTCERHSLCRDGVCVQMCLGLFEYGVCLSTEARCDFNGQGTVNLCEWSCDPTAQNCADGEGCYAIDDTFSCAPSAPNGPAGSAAVCEYINACDAGLICVNPEVRSDCSPEGGGCCTEICDLTEPDCPGDLECVAWHDDYPTRLPRHLEKVGICVDPI